MPRLKRFLSEVKAGKVPQTLWPFAEVGHTQEAKKELIDLVAYEQTDNVLDTVKPVRLMRRIIQIATLPNCQDIVLDFFSGSASMAQAVLEQNQEDAGDRRFIMVQFPEALPVPESKLKRLTDVGQMRIRAVLKRLTSGKGLSDEAKQSLGFRVFKLDSSNIRPWDPQAKNVKQTLLDAVEHVKPDRTDDDVLVELLLKLGLDLCVPTEEKTIAGKAVSCIGAGALFVCLAREIAGKDAETLANGIAAWRKELGTAGDSTAVFRDAAFEDDAAKLNLSKTLEQRGVKFVRSI